MVVLWRFRSSGMDKMSTDAEIQPVLRDLFRSQRFAVLATDDHGQPFASLMAFAATEDLGHIVVLTERATYKFANLKENSRVALLIDDRENKDSATQESVAVTALGEAQEVDLDASAPLLELYLARHPYLAAFAASPGCAIIRVKIRSYLLVSRFQKVVEWRIGS
jgi:heme iron utilization protein